MSHIGDQTLGCPQLSFHLPQLFILGRDLSPQLFAQKDAADLYDKLEKIIVPMYYSDRHTWVRMMLNAISKNAYYFNTHRMMRRYVTEAYIR